MFSYFLIILITVVFAQKENTSERNEKRVEEVLKQINLQSETGPASFHIFNVTFSSISHDVTLYFPLSLNRGTTPRPNTKFSRFALEHTLEYTRSNTHARTHTLEHTQIPDKHVPFLSVVDKTHIELKVRGTNRSIAFIILALF